MREIGFPRRLCVPGVRRECGGSAEGGGVRQKDACGIVAEDGNAPKLLLSPSWWDEPRNEGAPRRGTFTERNAGTGF